MPLVRSIALGALLGLTVAAGITHPLQAGCPQDVNELAAALETQRPREIPGTALEQARNLHETARRLHDSGDAIGCARVAQQALALVRRIASIDLLPVADLTGSRVEDSQGQRVGSLSDIVLDVGTGQAAFAVVKTPGLLGIGADAYAVPWRLLHRKPDSQTLALSIPAQRLEAAPRFSRDAWRETPPGDWARAIYTYYGVDPYGQAPAQATGEPAMGATASTARFESLAEQVKSLQAAIEELRQADRAAADDIRSRVESLSAKIVAMGARAAVAAPPDAASAMPPAESPTGAPASETPAKPDEPGTPQ